VDVWLHPFPQATASGYQLVQGLFGLGTGGIVGTGLGQGRPEIHAPASSQPILRHTTSRAARPSRAASRQALCPSTRPARPPPYRLTQPAIGPPTGVDPRNATACSAITRPRIVGSVVSWTVVLPTARNDTLAGPDQGEHQQFDRQTRRCRGGQDEQLERCGPIVSARSLVRPRPAVTRAPTAAPSPVAEAMQPYVEALP
jgi:Cell cycle protein